MTCQAALVIASSSHHSDRRCIANSVFKDDPSGVCTTAIADSTLVRGAFLNFFPGLAIEPSILSVTVRQNPTNRDDDATSANSRSVDMKPCQSQVDVAMSKPSMRTFTYGSLDLPKDLSRDAEEKSLRRSIKRMTRKMNLFGRKDEDKKS